MDRRDFIKTSAAASAGIAGSSWPFIHTQAQGRQYRTALIGSGWWGMNILTAAIEAGQSKVVAMCDVDENMLDDAVKKVESISSDQPKKYKDYRELLDREKPEIVIIATPDHWHCLPCLHAINNGAHVYLEKPIGHTINEGRAMVNAARAQNRIVQVGTHRRVSPHNKSGMEFIKSGKVGDIGMVRAFVHYPGDAGEPTPNEDPPSGLDWDMWCGPAPKTPYNPDIHPKGFRQYLDYANGTLGDWGIHWLDHILWWTDELYPKKVHSTGGRHIKETSTTAPDTQVVNYEFEDFTAVWEHRRYAGNRPEHTNIGCYFYGTEGVFHMGWLDGWTFFPSNKDKPTIHEDPQLHDPDKQNIPELWQDFLTSIEKKQHPVCDIEIGHRSTNMSLLGMLSYKLGRSIEWDGDNQKIVGDQEANNLLSREYRGPWEYPAV